MKKVSYDKESWLNFFQSVSENFEAEAEEILKDIENAVITESLRGLSSRRKEYLKKAFGESNDFLALDWVSDTIELTREEIRLYAKSLFSRDDYMEKDNKVYVKERIKFLKKEMKEKNLKFSRTKGFDNQTPPNFRRLPSFLFSERELNNQKKKEPEEESEDVPF